eukprot:maker-scaffold224_size251237-snap-gene-0.15 protein:Tk05435 transcript:maker-scaffold224_size251237-snap-gene-0.15-mRNA-1 annotation:"kh domain-containing protein"
MAFRRGPRAAFLLTVVVASTAWAYYWLYLRRRSRPPTPELTMAQLEHQAEAAASLSSQPGDTAAPRPAAEAETRPEAARTHVESQAKKRLDEEQLSSELQKLNIHSEDMAPLPQEVKSQENHPVSQEKPAIAHRHKESLTSKANPDSGVVSPCGTGSATPAHLQANPAQAKTRSDSTDCGLGGSLYGEEEAGELGSHEEGQALSDSGQGSEADEQNAPVLSYHLQVPLRLCGKFIGIQGAVINHFKAASNCTMTLKGLQNSRGQSNRSKGRDSSEGPQTCIIDGTRVNIEKCLELIREKFPLEDFPEMTLHQVNCALEDPSNITTSMVSPQHALVTGVLQEFAVTAINSGGSVSVQLPNNFYFSSLEHLMKCMYHTYFELDTPSVPRPVLPNLLCAAPFENQWYRVQVISYDSANDTCDAHFVDFGGFANFRGVDLRQIRTDFTILPFQAIDCYLANVMPSDGEVWSPQSAVALQELINNKACSGRMVGFAPDGNPFIELFVAEEDCKDPENQAIMANRVLVDQGHAAWVEDDLPEFEAEVNAS